MKPTVRPGSPCFSSGPCAKHPGHSAAYQDLDVTILQSLVLEKGLGLTPEDMGGERMPLKTTYSYPKLPSGLVFLDLHGST